MSAYKGHRPQDHLTVAEWLLLHDTDVHVATLGSQLIRNRAVADWYVSEMGEVWVTAEAIYSDDGYEVYGVSQDGDRDVLIVSEVKTTIWSPVYEHGCEYEPGYEFVGYIAASAAEAAAVRRYVRLAA